MNAPFLYPKSKHIRKYVPRSYSQYQRYKPILQQEFNGGCVYCRLPDSIKGDDSFGVDHYRPQKHFPQLSTEYLNLYYSCNRCNSHKGSFWPNVRQRKAGQYIPNPCEHVMFEHLRYKGDVIAASTPTGEWAIELLDLNEPKLVEYRNFVLGIVSTISDKLRMCQKTLSEINKKLKSTKDPGEIALLSKEYMMAESRVMELKTLFDKATGNISN